MLVRVHVQRVVWAGLCTCLAADATAVVKIDDPVLSREERGDGADLNTWCVGAVITPHNRKQPPRIGKGAFLDVFDPCSIYAHWHLVLGLAGNSAGVTTDTLSVVDDEAEIHIEFDFRRMLPANHANRDE
jgi:hypothetical protein